MPPSRRLRLALLVAAVVAFAVALLVPGLEHGIVFLSPAIVLLASLLSGHYVGERRLERFVSARGARRPRAATSPALPRRPRARMPRGGRLVATSLAVRPPPLLLLATR